MDTNAVDDQSNQVAHVHDSSHSRQIRSLDTGSRTWCMCRPMCMKLRISRKGSSIMRHNANGRTNTGTT